jgi:hypothetical protein
VPVLWSPLPIPGPVCRGGFAVKLSGHGHGVVSQAGVGIQRELADLTGLSAQFTAVSQITNRAVHNFRPSAPTRSADEECFDRLSVNAVWPVSDEKRSLRTESPRVGYGLPAAALRSAHKLGEDFTGEGPGAMRISVMAVAGLVGASALVGVTVAGCNSGSKSSTAPSGSAASTTTSSTSSSSASSSAQAQPADYTGLLIKATDINAPEIFTASPPMQNPNGKAGVATTFSNPDGSHVIGDTILILPDPSAAASALDSAKAALGGAVSGTPGPADVGTGGTTVSGNSPDGSKSVTVVLFTEGSAFTTLEFDGPPNAAVPPDFVTDVSQKQVAAIKNGLPG